MKFLSSERNLRFIYVIAAAYCFILISLSFVETMITGRQTIDDCLWIDNLNGAVPDSGTYIVQITKDGVADHAGLKNGDLLLKINGQSFKNSTEAQRILNSYSNENVTYTILRSGIKMDTKVWVYKFFNTLYLIFASISYLFLFIGFLVGYSKPKEFTSKLFFALGCTSMGLLVFSNVNYQSINSGDFVFFNYVGGLLLFPPVFLHFCLTYPIRYEFGSRKKVILCLYAFSILLFIFQPLIKIFNLPPALFNISLYNFSALYILGGVGFFINSYKKLKDTSLHQSLNIILKGLILGAIGFVYYFVMQFFISLPAFLLNPAVFIPAVLVLAIPLSFGYSIFKYRILDTEFIIKRGLVFGIISVFIIGIYLTLVFVLNSVLSNYFAENKQLLTILALVIITFSFDFVNKKARSFVDKQFYRERYNYRKALLEFSQELPYLNNFNEILKRISSSVNETMGVSKINIWILEEEFFSLVEQNNEVTFRQYKAITKQNYDNAFKALHKINREPKLLYEMNLADSRLNNEYIELIKNEEIVLSIPIYLKEKLVGALNFGSKPSGKAYSEEDIDLLKTLASQSAVAFENSRLQKEEIQKQKIEEELIIAKKIQESLLPQAKIDIPGIEISWLSKPAKEIGGDLCDMVKLDNDKVLVFVADVSGKGVPAALYMSQIQVMLQFASSINSSPKEILAEVNKLIFEKMDKRSFVTIIAALFNIKDKTVTIARAGHNPAIAALNGKAELVNAKGMGLGLESDKLFVNNLEEKVLPMPEGSLFMFYSDGLTEAMNKKKELFDVSRVLNVISQNRNSHPDELMSVFADEVRNFTLGAEQHDDITLVIVKVNK